MKKLLLVLSFILVVFILITIPSSNSFAANKDYGQFKTNVPKITDNMMNADFWIKNTKDVDKIIMSNDKIQQYNKSLQEKEPEIVNLQDYKIALKQDELKSMILAVSSPASTPRYNKDGKQVTQSYYNNLKENLNLNGLQMENKVQYGITVKRTEMRTYPTQDALFKEGDNYEFDRLMETAVYPVEPLLILSTSKDKKWFFAQSYNYLAWIPAADVAITTKEELFKYVNTKEFLITTGAKTLTVNDPLNSQTSELELDMGIKIPLASENEIGDEVDGQNPTGNYVVKLPVRDSNGNMALKYALISKTEDVNLGYLSYNKRNILNQAFKFLGQRYGWGGMFDGTDCSGFILDIYRSMGINLPRNTGEQANVTFAKTYNMPNEMTLSERQKLLQGVDTESELYMSGHVMLYLGQYKGEQYMIHNFSGFYKKGEDGKYKYYNSREVMVTPVTIGSNESGKTYLEEMTTAKNFTFNK